PFIRLLTPDRLRYVLARVARWFVENERGRRSAYPPMAVVRDMLSHPDPPLPVLKRMVEAPVFGPDGTLELTPGYQRHSGHYYAPVCGFTIPPVSGNPSQDEILRATETLTQDLLGEFPFISPGERGHGLAALLLPFARSLFEGSSPLHLIEAPVPGTGKTLLADVLTFPATGRRLAAMAEGRDDDEWRKRITAKLLEVP